MSYIGYKRTIQLDFDYEKVKQGVPKVNQQMALLNAEFNKTSASVKATGSAFDKLATNNQKLANQVQLQKDKVSQLQKELEKLTTAENKNERAITSKQIALKNAQAQLTNMQTAYAKSNLEMQKATTLSGQAKLAMEDMRLGFERAGINVDQLKGHFVALGLAIVAFVGSTTKAFMTFEESMIKSRTIMDETKVSYKQMSDDVMNMSSKYGMSAKDMAEANYEILSSAIDTAEANRVLEQSVILAKTGFTDTATAADILTSIINAYGKSTEETAYIVDTLIKTQELGKLTIGDMSASLGDLISISSSCKVPLEQVEAAIATMTLSGTKADTAIMQVKNIMAALISPTQEAAAAAEELGIEFSAVALQRKGFAEFMDDIMRKTGGSVEKIGMLFGNIRSLNGILNLTKDDGKKFAEVLKEIENSSGMANESLEIIEDTVGAKLKKAIEQLKNALIDIGETLSPLIEVIANVISSFANLPQPVILTIAGFAALSLTITLLTKVFAGLSMAGGIVGAIMAKLGLTSGAAAVGMGASTATGGILSKILGGLGISAGASATALGATATTGGATATALGATAATSGTAAAGLGGVGVAGGAAGGGLMMTGAGASMAMGPILILIAAVAALVLILALCSGGGKEAANSLSQTGKTAQGVAADVTKAADTADKQAKRMQKAASASSYTSKTSMGGYATGTNYVKEEGWYRYNEYNQEETLLRRGDRVLNGAQTRQLQENSKVDMSETNSLLKSLCREFSEMKRAYQEQPKQLQRLAREGGI